MSILLGSLQDHHGWSATSNDTRSSIGRLLSFFNGTSNAGEQVTEASSMSVAAYYACLRVISEDIAKLPLVLYRHTSTDGGKHGKQRAVNHPLYQVLLSSPNREMGAMSFWESAIAQAASQGAGYAEIVHDGAGNVRELWPIHPSRMLVSRDIQTGELFYDVISDDISGRTPAVRLPPSKVFHLHGLGPDGLNGWSVMRNAAESLGLSIAAQKLAGSFYRNGAAVSGVLEYPEAMSDGAFQRLRESWAQSYGGAKNGGKPVILEEGAKYQRIGIPPNEAQFLESRQFQIEEIARWFRIAPVKIGHNQNTPFSNIEALNTAHVNDALMPWMVRAEQEINRKLLLPNERKRYFAEFDASSLLRGDFAARANMHRTLFQIAAITPNEVREKEGLDPVPGGDTRYMQSNMATVDQINEGKTTSTSGNNVASSEGPEEGPEHGVDAVDSVRPMLFDAASRASKRQENAISRAQKREGEDFSVWLEDFKRSESTTLSSIFEPVVASISRITGHNLDQFLADWAQNEAQSLSIDTVSVTLLADSFENAINEVIA